MLTYGDVYEIACAPLVLVSSDGYELPISAELAMQIPCTSESLRLPVALVDLAQVLQVLRGEAERSAKLEPAFLSLGFEPMPQQALHFVPDEVSDAAASCAPLMTLVARGMQNIYTDGNQYRKTYGPNDPRVPERNDAYSEGSNRLLDEPMRFGSSKSISVPRYGDGWSGLVAKITLPSLPKGLRWRSDVMEQIVASFDLAVGGSSIYNCSGALNAAVCTAFNKWPVQESLRYVEKLSEAERYARSSKPWLVIVPLLVPPMWHDSNLVELITLQYHEIRVTLSLAPLGHLICGSTDAEANLAVDARVYLEADYVFMDTELRDNVGQGRVASTAGKSSPVLVSADATPRTLAHEQCVEIVEQVPEAKRNAARAALQRYAAHVTLAEADARALQAVCEAEDLLGSLAELSALQQRVCAAIVEDPRVAQLWTRYAEPASALSLLQKSNNGAYTKSNALGTPQGALKLSSGITQSNAIGTPQGALNLSSGLLEQHLPQIQWQVDEFDSTTKTLKRFPLYLNHPCAFLVLVFRCTDEALMMEADAHPFQRMKLLLNGHAFQTSDAIKAHEWNWKKCDALGSPAPHQKIYLLPFSKHALRWDERGFPCTTNMSRIDNATLELEPNTAINTHWQVQIGTASQNLFRQCAGMGAQAWSN